MRDHWDWPRGLTVFVSGAPSRSARVGKNEGGAAIAAPPLRKDVKGLTPHTYGLDDIVTTAES